MTEFRPFIIAFLLVGLFMFAMLSFATNLQEENETPIRLNNDPTVVNLTGSLNSQLAGFEETANEQREAFEKDTPVTGLGELIFNSITQVGRVIGGTATSFYTIIAVAATAIGVSPMVINIIGGIIVITIVLLAWALYRTGK